MNFKRFSTYMVALSVIALGVWACQNYSGKVDLKPEVNAIPQFQNLTSITCPPSNLSNPYDSVGLMHNYILNMVSDCANILECVSSANSVWYGLYGTLFSGFTLPTSQNVSLIIADTANQFHGIIQSASYSANVNSNLQNLFRIISDTTDTTIVDFCIFKSKIVTFENSVINNVNLSEIEKVQILSASSIARYSFQHWTNEFIEENGNKPGSIYQPLGWKWWRKFLRVCAIVCCDVAGGVAGGATMISIGQTHPFAIGCGAVSFGSSASAAVAGWIKP